MNRSRVLGPRTSDLDPRPSTLDSRPSILDPRPAILDPRSSGPVSAWTAVGPGGVSRPRPRLPHARYASQSATLPPRRGWLPPLPHDALGGASPRTWCGGRCAAGGMGGGTERDRGRGWGIGTLREAPAWREADPGALCGRGGGGVSSDGRGPGCGAAAAAGLTSDVMSP